MREGEGFVRFEGDANDFYQRINSPDEVVGLWEQLSYIADNNQVDNERIWEMLTEDDLRKVVYGPPFTIVFKNLLGGRLVVYTIRRPSF